MPDYDVMGQEDLLGAEQDILGAVVRAAQRQLARRPGGAPAGRGMPFARPPLPPRSTPESRLRTPMGAGVATWAPADAADKPLTVEPQSTFRAERLVVDVVATGGTFGGLVLVRNITVGNTPQSPSSQQPMPASMFRPDVTYGSMDLTVADRAGQLSALLGVSAAPGAGITVQAACGWYGEWIGRTNN